MVRYATIMISTHRQQYSTSLGSTSHPQPSIVAATILRFVAPNLISSRGEANGKYHWAHHIYAMG